LVLDAAYRTGRATGVTPRTSARRSFGSAPSLR